MTSKLITPFEHSLLEADAVIVGTPKSLSWSPKSDEVLLLVEKPTFLLADFDQGKTIQSESKSVLIWNPNKYSSQDPLVWLGKEQILFLKKANLNEDRTKQFDVKDKIVYELCQGRQASLLLESPPEAQPTQITEVVENKAVADFVRDISAFRRMEDSQPQVDFLLEELGNHKGNAVYEDNIIPLIKLVLMEKVLNEEEKKNIFDIALEINSKGYWFYSIYKRKLANILIFGLNKNSKDKNYVSHITSILKSMGVGYTENNGIYRWDGAPLWRGGNKPGAQWIGTVPEK